MRIRVAPLAQRPMNGDGAVVLKDESLILPSPLVLSCNQGNVIVLMSLLTDRYHTLDECGSMIWEAVCRGGTLSQIVDTALAMEPSDDSSAKDVRAFIGQLLAMGLICVNKPKTRRRHHRPVTSGSNADQSRSVPQIWLCAIALAVVSVGLRFAGLARVWRRAHGDHATNMARPPSHFYCEEIAARVVLASSFYPLRSQCLEQSLVALWWLRRNGVDAHLRFGVLQYPFKAHAWLEVDGSPINDDSDRLRMYRPFSLLDWSAL